MKYGDLSKPGIDLEQEREILREACKKGLITEEQLKENLKNITRNYTAWLVMTNGAGIRNRKRKTKAQLDSGREAHIENKIRDIAKRLNAEETT